MIISPDSLFAFPQTSALLQAELACVPEVARQRPAGAALVLQACAAQRDLALDLAHLRGVRLHVAQHGWRGDVSCDADALPFDGDAFQLVVVQHAGEALPTAHGLPAELARVLAPGGTLLWFGFNRWSPWLAWLHWQARTGLAAPNASSSERVRRQLLQAGLEVGAAATFGSCWPSRAVGDGALAPLRAAWRLLASKQQLVLTPLRPRRRRMQVAARPSLALPSRRSSA
ncbi:MAG: methyltransferase domain-containing protein [Dokdonella sp.]|nr:MAG: methyltransferase domain-containing protein [Dokdonella sp.]